MPDAKAFSAFASAQAYAPRASSFASSGNPATEAHAEAIGERHLAHCTPASGHRSMHSVSSQAPFERRTGPSPGAYLVDGVPHVFAQGDSQACAASNCPYPRRTNALTCQQHAPVRQSSSERTNIAADNLIATPLRVWLFVRLPCVPLKWATRSASSHSAIATPSNG